jgi:hypothetical protein
LRGHLGGFLGGTAEGNEDLGKLRGFHGEKIYQKNKNAGIGT